MFAKSARYYDALYRFKDYTHAAQAIDKLIGERSPGATSILDVGCGTGKHLAALGARYEVAGLDINPDLLDIANANCPAGSFHCGDMADFDLGRSFDVVICLFSSIGYVKTRERLFSTVAAMAAHLNRGGLLLLEPWFTPETYWVGHLATNYVDEPDLKISWMYVSELRDGMTALDIHYQVGTPDGVSQFRELHEMGLFTQDEIFDAFAKARLEAAFDDEGFFGRGLYIAQAVQG
jgi:SAM-dependent methyltransferase